MNVVINNIVKELEENGISEKMFMEDLKFHRTLMYDWKSGRSKSYMKRLNEIADYLNVSVEYLLGNTSIKNKPVFNEEDKLTAEFYEIVKNFSPEEVEQALDYVRYLALKKEMKQK